MIDQTTIKSTTPSQRPEIVDVYEEWDFIDAKDNVGDWRVGIIVQKNDRLKQMKVRFDGWPPKYDQYYKFGSQKLEHFRFITLGYSGQKINPAHRIHWKFSQEELEQKLIKLKTFMKKDRFDLKGYELTQYLRGKHFIYVDCLLQTKFSELTQLKTAILYLKTHIDITLQYLEIFDATFKNANEDISISTQAAFQNSYYELFDACTSIFGGYKRINPFYKNNQKLVLQLKDLKSKPSNNLNADQLAQFCIKNIYLTYFNEKGGWNILQNLFMKLLNLNKKSIIPFPFLQSLLSFYFQLNKFNLPNKIKKYTDLLIEITKRNLMNINQKIIKETDRTAISKVTDKLISMLSRNSDIQRSSASIAKTVSTHQQTDQLIKQFQILDLRISYQYFKSPYFEKKLNGITCLKDSLSKIDLKKISAQQYYDWALSIGLLKEICDDNTHVEIIKRASQIIRLLCQNKVLTNPTLDLIWQARSDKHQTTLKALDELLLQISSYLNSEQIDYLFSKIIKVPIESWDPDYLELVKKFSEYSIRQSKKPQNDFGIPAIYAYAELKQDQKSLTALFDLLNISWMDKQLIQYQNISIKKIKQGKNPYFHILLLLKIQKNSTSVASVDRATVQVLIQDIMNNYDKIDELPSRFELLDSISPNHCIQITLTFQDLDNLWNVFKKDQKNTQAAEIFLRWLCPYDENLNYYKIKSYLSSDTKLYIFKQILCNHKKNDFFNMNLVECNIFLAFFVDVNINHSKLIKAKVNGAKFKTKNLDLIGIQQLWGIFLNCKNSQCTKRTAQFICDIHIKLSIDLQKSKEDIGMKLIDKAVDHISNGIRKQNHLMVKNFLMLLSTFINKIEGYFQLDQNFRPRSIFIKQFTVINSANNQKVDIKVNTYTPFGLLRKRIGKIFNTDTRYFQLEHKSKTNISRDSDQNLVIECMLAQTIHFIPCQQKENFVKKYLNKYLQLFLDMLSTEYAKQVWNIVSVLPVSEQMSSKIDQVKNWETFLQGGIYRQLYLLRIISAMRIQEWQKFISNNGVKSITNKLNTTITQQIDIEYLKQLTNILKKCICSQKKDEKLFISQNLTSISNQLIQLLNKLLLYTIKNQDNKQFPNKQELNLGNNIFQILYKIRTYIRILVCFSSLPNFKTLLENGLIRCPNSQLRQVFCIELLKLIIHQKTNQPDQTTSISITVFSLLLETILKQQKTKIFFQFSIKLIERLDLSNLESVFKAVPNIIKRLIRFLDQNDGELTYNTENETFWGVTQLIKQILSRKQLQVEQFDREHLANYILNECLFEFKKNKLLPKCKSESTRTSAFQLLWVLISDNAKLTQKVISFLSEFNKNGAWRTNKWTQWALNPKTLQKSTTGYVGLKNLGCICYMNSFLQQVFMIPSFRQQILTAEDPMFDKIKEEDNLLYQLKSMFVALEQSEQQYYNPKPFTFAFKDYDGKPTNVLEQMDIDEFSGFLLDKLQTQLKGSKNASNVVNNHFSGIISNQIICKGCPHYSENKQPFVSLGLQVKNKQDIYQSLDALIKGQMLEGQNAYFCERCSKKVSALKRGCIKQLPNHLIVALKRFQFNYETMTKSKINDYCKFPHNLNLQKYSQNYLRKTQNNDNKFGEDETHIQYQPQYYEYELKGVVIHLGFADNGHYYSYIEDNKEEEGSKEWFEFNDTVVRKFDVNNLADEAFGGQQKSMDLTIKQKNRNAYLLFYERKIKLDHNGNKIDNNSIRTPRNQLPYLNKFIHDLKQSNQKYSLFRLVFSPDYNQFIKCITSSPDVLDSQTNLELLNFVLVYYLTRTIRDHNKKLSYEIGEILVQKAKNNIQFAMRILRAFSQQATIQQLIKFNPLKQIKKLLANFIIEIARIVYKVQGKGASNRLFETEEGTQIPTTVLGNFINSLLKSGTSGKFLQFNNEMYMILAKIAEFGPETAEYLLRKKTLGIVLLSLLEKQSKNKIQFQTQKQQHIIGKIVVDQKQVTLLNFKNKNKKQEEKTYIWYLLTELIQHCDFRIQQYPQYFTSTKFNLPMEELQLVYLTPSVIYNAVSEAKGKLMMRKLIKYVCTICIENHKLSEEIPNLLSKGLKQLICSKFRGLLMLCKSFIRIPDKLSSNRMGAVSIQIKKGLEQNKTYSVELDVISQWYIKYARKNPEFRKYIKVHNTTLKYILQINKQRIVPQNIAKNQRTISDKLYHVLHGIMMLKSQTSYKQLSKFKTKQLMALIQGTDLPVRGDEEWDSDDDLQNKQLQKDQIVMGFLDKIILNFVEMKVVSNMLNRLTLEHNGDLYQFYKDEELLTTQHTVLTFDENRNNLICQSEETASVGSFNEPDS